MLSNPVTILLSALTLLVLLGIVLQQRKLRGLGGLVDRLDARLGEQGKHSEALSNRLGEQARETTEIVRSLDRDLRERQSDSRRELTEQLAEARQKQQEAIHKVETGLVESFGELRRVLEQRHSEALKTLQGTLETGVDRVQEQVAGALKRNSEELGKRMSALTESTDRKLQEISGQVEKRLSEGFEKTTSTFTDVVKRLVLIDEAQKKITELSTNVVSLQEVLADRTSRGAFGEVQLHDLVQNLLPKGNYAMQHTLANGKVVDCMLFLPAPTGHVPVDSKFPLDNYRRQMDPNLAPEERKLAQSAFSRDVRKHIEDISSKYVHPPETSDGAIMFIPAEAVFAEIHGNHPDLVEIAHRQRVWMTSPTTLMAIVTTARAVLKDEATRKQVHIIRDHLSKLSGDFGRFQTRMDQLARHIHQADEDVSGVNISARKISSRFEKIESLEVDNGEPASLAEGKQTEPETGDSAE